MTDQIEIVSAEDYTPTPAPPKPVRETVREMAKVVTYGEGFESAEEIDAEVAREGSTSAVRSAFDRGATLAMPEPEPPPVIPSAASRPARPSRVKPTPVKGGRPAGSDQLTDLFAAGLITLIAFTLGDWAQPEEQEAKDLARPLGNILARRIDLAAKLGQDANDTVAFAIALMAYLVRVGPIATERVRNVWADRQSRERVDRVLPGPRDSDRESGVPARGAARSGTGPSASYNPLDAVARARETGLRSLDRDFGYPVDGNTAVGDHG